MSPARRLFALAAVGLAIAAAAQTVPAVPPPSSGPVTASTGSFSGNVTSAGTVSAAVFDGGTADIDSLRVTGGPNSIDGGTTFGGDLVGFGGLTLGNYLAGRDAGFHNVTATGTLGINSFATFGSSISSPLFDGGAVLATTGSFSGYLAGQDAGLNNLTLSGTFGVNGAATHGAVISAPAFDGGAFQGTTGTLSGTLGVDGLATFGTTVSSPGFDGGSFRGTTGQLSGTLGVDGLATFGSALSAPVLDGGAVNGTTITASGNITTTGGKVNVAGGSELTSDGRVKIPSTQFLIASGTCNTRGSTGTQTCNQMGGHATMAASASAVQINNQIVGTATVVVGNLQSNDATCKSLSFRPDAGSFVVQVNAVCGANADFNWMILPNQ